MTASVGAGIPGSTIVPSPRLIWLLALAGFPAAVVVGIASQLRGAAVVLIVAIAIAALVDAMLRRRAFEGLRIELPPLLRLVQGRDADIPLTIHNSRADRRRIRIGFAMPSGVDLQPEQQSIEVDDAVSRIDWSCQPNARGNYKIKECYLEASSPLGLWAVRGTQPLSLEIRVYPNLRDDSSLKALRRGGDSRHRTRQLGRGREFEKLREYAPGDSLDEIHWKAAAHRGRPITKVFQVERTQEIYIVIDASRLTARTIGGQSALEFSIKAALTVGAVAERRGDLFGIAAFSDRVERFVRARGGKLHFSACREAINDLHSRLVSPDFEEIATFLRLRLHRRSLLMFLTALDDPILAQHFERSAQLLGSRHRVMAATLNPPFAQPLFHDPGIESAEEIYGALAGHLEWIKLHELQSVLARQGVRLALLQPESFSERLVSLYDDVKQRQLL